METIWQDLRYAARTLLKSPGYTAVAVLTLMLGIGANTAMFSVVDAVLLRPLPYPNAPRVVNLFEKRPAEHMLKFSVSPGDFYEWREKSRSFENMAACTEHDFNLTGLGEPRRTYAAVVAPGFFEVLGVGPVAGRTFQIQEETQGADRVVILSDGFWKRALGADPGVVGRTLQLDGFSYTIIGVLPPGFRYPFADERDIFVPMAFSPAARVYHGAHFLAAIASLRPGVSTRQAQAEMDLIAQQMEREYPVNLGHGVNLIPLRETLTGDIRPALLVLLGAVGLVLLIACANVANLLLARGKSREKEIAIRAALGSSRLRIVRQLLTESALLGMLGGTLAVALAYWTVDALRALFFTRLDPFMTAGLDRSAIDVRVLAFTFALSLLTACLFGLAPALAFSRVDLNNALKQGSRGSSAGNRRGFRNVLVIAEVALSVVLLAGAGLLLRSFDKLLRVDLGYRPNHVLAMALELPAARYDKQPQASAFYQQLLDHVRALPGVRSAGLADIFPLTGDDIRQTMHLEGHIVQPGETTRLHPRLVTPGYLETMGIRLLRGRDITSADSLGTTAVGIISESAARTYWPNRDPIGSRFTFDDENKDWIEVVGIAADVKHRALDEDITADVYLPIVQRTGGQVHRSFTVAARTAGDPVALAAAFRSQVVALDPNLPVAAMHSLEQLVTASVAPRKFNVTLLGIFAALALLLSTVGVYGVMAYTVDERTHELGIRVALGAQPRNVFRLVIGQGMALTMLGVALGIAAALGVTRFLATLLFGVSASDLLTFGGVAVLLIGVAFLACYLPARRAMRVDPIIALRCE